MWHLSLLWSSLFVLNIQFIVNQTEYDLDDQIRNCIILLEKQWSGKNIEINLNLESVKIYSNEEMLWHHG